jgi:hypothetical protein
MRWVCVALALCAAPASAGVIYTGNMADGDVYLDALPSTDQTGLLARYTKGGLYTYTIDFEKPIGDFNAVEISYDYNYEYYTEDFSPTLFGNTNFQVATYILTEGAQSVTFAFDVLEPILERTTTCPGCAWVTVGLLSPIRPLLAFAGEDNRYTVTLQSPAPEPATWAFFIIGFGAVGGALRRARPVASSPSARLGMSQT